MAADPAAYAGLWNLKQPNGTPCRVRLIDREIGGKRPLHKTGCFDDMLFGAVKRTLRGTQMVFLDIRGRDVATPRVTEPNRLDGAGMVMSREGRAFRPA